MLILHHLFIGLTVGIILAVMFSNKWAILYGGIGAILPDLLDKPLGHILLSDTLSGGRIYMHTLTLSATMIFLGLLIWIQNRKHILILCLGVGVLIHQLCDGMWQAPVNWFWPLFGSFPPLSEMQSSMPDGYLTNFYFPPWLLIVITGAIMIATVYRYPTPYVMGLYHRLTEYWMKFYQHLTPYRMRRKQNKKIFTVIRIILTIGIAILLAKFIFWDIFLTGSWAEYFKTMYLKELWSISEWTYGVASLTMILLLFDYPIRFSKKTKKHIVGICGVGLVCVSLLILILLGFEIPVDEVYGMGIWRILAVCGLFIGGLVLILLGNIVWKLSEKRPDLKL